MSRDAPWKGSRDGPWPSVRIDGDLDRAAAEWLHTNGAGAYAMSTLALMHTRRQHGLLVAALEPPLGQTLILSHAETSVDVEQRSYRLSTHQFPGIAPTPGYRWLKSFSQDPIPRWTYRLGKGTLDRTLCLVRGKNAAVLSYSWTGRSRARLSLRPLMPLRPIDELSREHGAMVQTVTLRSGRVEVRPVPSIPPIWFGHSGMFMGSPDWWRRFEYLADRGLYESFEEDLWSPGVFEIELSPNKTSFLVVAVGEPPTEPPEELVAQAREYLLAQDPGAQRLSTTRILHVAAEQFVVDACARPCVYTGYPSVGVYTRDWAMSVPGLLFAREQWERGQRMLEALARQLHAGLLPLTLAGRGESRPRPCPDATLWLVESARALYDHAGPGDPALLRVLFPAIRRIFARIRGRRSSWVWLSEDGLVANAAPSMPLTWMDAQLGEELYTPRRGLAIELQALWTRCCDTLSRMARDYDRPALSACADEHARRARAAFHERFWCSDSDYPYDCVSEVRHGEDAWEDRSVRPNALIALSLDRLLFDEWQAQAILERVRQDLLTPRGVRTLTTSDPRYVGRFSGDRVDRVSAYHQGTVWPFLLGHYARAALHSAADPEQTRLELGALLEGATDTGTALGHVAQLADGDPPFGPRGCPASSASVAELLRVLCTELQP
jgi:predicted glycogen debranching enzyme